MTDVNIIVALDVPGQKEALALVEQLGEEVRWVKVGMELFYAAGPGIVTELKKRDLRVFLDLKLHDIPNTVSRAVRTVRHLGADMLNVHAAGGCSMMEEAVIAADGQVKMIAVTQLTSTDQRMLNSELGITGSVADSVLDLARLAKKAGMSGVVCSPQETARIKEDLGKEFLAVTPGIRPATTSDDQKRTADPVAAARAGSDFLVIGRPITAAENPTMALRAIMKSLEV